MLIYLLISRIDLAILLWRFPKLSLKGGKVLNIEYHTPPSTKNPLTFTHLDINQNHR